MAKGQKPNFTRYSPPKSGPQGGGSKGGSTPKSKSFTGGSNTHMGASRVGGNANNTGKK